MPQTRDNIIKKFQSFWSQEHPGKVKKTLYAADEGLMSPSRCKIPRLLLREAVHHVATP
jgi:hypothetical protein